MSRTTQAEIDNIVLQSLRDAQRELSPRELIKLVTAATQFKEVDVKRAIWRLIANDLVRLSEDQSLIATAAQERAA